MEYRLLGWPADGPTLDLDHRQFRYAGKFVVSSTGKFVAREDGEVLGATAFDEDRTDPSTLRIRYVTVHDDRRGEGIGTALLERTLEAGRERGYDSVRIAVNNPFAYEAAYRAGFGFTGETTGIAELLLAAPSPVEDRYHDGFEAFADRDVELSEPEREFVRRKLASKSPR